MGAAPQSPSESVFRGMPPICLSKLFSRIGVRVILLIALFLTTVHFLGSSIPQFRINNIPPPAFPQGNKLHFLLPASSPDSNLFKAFVSATILGYPIPTIINWGTYTNADGSDVMNSTNSPARRARQMEKLYSVAQYLDSLTDVHEDDLVLMTDSLDTWFQLPPSVLLSRYYNINPRAQGHGEEEAQYGPEVVKNTKHPVIFSAEKKCWPREAEDMGCSAVPESPLPKTLFGSLTDLVIEGEDEFRFIRPRYLNSGFLLSPVREARILFERAAQIAHTDPDVFGADQGIIAQMFGEQEYMSKPEHPRDEQNGLRSLSKRGKVVDFVPEKDRSYDFGISLDYEGALALPTAHAQNDTTWITMSNTEQMDNIAQAMGITEPRDASGLQADVAALPGPFESLPDTFPAEVRSKSWSDVSLYMNLWTSVVPATIHVNSLDALDRKVMREISWWRMWFVPYIRPLYEIQTAKLHRSPDDYQLVASHDGKDFYGTIPNEIMRRKEHGAQTVDKNGKVGWLRWDELCDEQGRRDVVEMGSKQPGLG